MSKQTRMSEQARIKMIAGMIAVVFLLQLVSCNVTEDTAPTQKKSLKDLIASGRTPADLIGYDTRSREIFSRYDSDVPLMVKYLKPDGSGDGSSFSNAARDLKSVLEGITDASASNVYVVLLTGGTYTPEIMAMKNHVAIVGGVDEDLGSDGVTVLDGREDRVFDNFDNGLTDTALLYGVTVTNGKGEDGGGMRNHKSSPSLVGVTFSENTADYGGGLYNEESFPSLVRVTFSGNTAHQDGGGMFNESSSPTLDGVTFSGNTAEWEGGGMYNVNYEKKSSPILVGVTFSGNSATDGGGIYNYNSSPILVGVTFSGNTADGLGGAMFNDNDSEEGPLIINAIFWGNNDTSSGPEFYFDTDNFRQENLRIYNSIVEGGTGNLVSGTTNTSVNQGGFVSGGGIAPVVIFFADIIGKHPGLRPLADNGGSVLTHAIAKTSPAVNQGLYVKKSGKDFYYSKYGFVWYTEPDLSGARVTPPRDAENLTDATGYSRRGRPDLGAYESR